MKSALYSLATHGFLVGTIAFILASDAPSVRGGAGLRGSPRTQFQMTVSSEVSADEAKPTKTKVTAAREGIEIPVQRELPTEVKNAKPREIDTPPSAQNVKSDGDSSEGPVGPQGQGGSGDTAEERIGNSDRSNALGIYLMKMHRKIQSNLEPAGYLAFEYRTVLTLTLRKSGQVDQISVSKSSGDRILDQKAVNAVKRSLPFDPWEYDQTIQVPVKFRATD